MSLLLAAVSYSIMHAQNFALINLNLELNICHCAKASFSLLLIRVISKDEEKFNLFPGNVIVSSCLYSTEEEYITVLCMQKLSLGRSGH